MPDNKHIKNVVFWLTSQGLIGSQEDLAIKLGYNPSFFSQIISGNKPMSNKFVQKIVAFCDNINPDYLITGEGSMLKSPPDTTSPKRNLIPLYNTYSVGGTGVVAPNDSITAPSEWIDAGDWFREATAAMHHYGDSMVEYPSGCILVFREIFDKELIIWGKNYVIETDEFRITKRLQRSDNPDYVIAYSSNEETYKDGTLIHQPIDIPKSSIRRLAIVLGYVVKEQSSARAYSINRT